MHNSTGYVIKQLAHAFSCALSGYGALGKFGEHSRINNIITNVFIHHKIKTTYLCYIITILIKYSIRSHVKIVFIS